MGICIGICECCALRNIFLTFSGFPSALSQSRLHQARSNPRDQSHPEGILLRASPFAFRQDISQGTVLLYLTSQTLFLNYPRSRRWILSA